VGIKLDVVIATVKSLSKTSSRSHQELPKCSVKTRVVSDSMWMISDRQKSFPQLISMTRFRIYTSVSTVRFLLSSMTRTSSQKWCQNPMGTKIQSLIPRDRHVARFGVLKANSRIMRVPELPPAQSNRASLILWFFSRTFPPESEFQSHSRHCKSLIWVIIMFQVIR